ncbi:MAG: leucine-rich repeat domain-containing protein [Candidatus Thorarchaeota archaeon]
MVGIRTVALHIGILGCFLESSVFLLLLYADIVGAVTPEFVMLFIWMSGIAITCLVIGFLYLRFQRPDPREREGGCGCSCGMIIMIFISILIPSLGSSDPNFNSMQYAALVLVFHILIFSFAGFLFIVRRNRSIRPNFSGLLGFEMMLWLVYLIVISNTLVNVTSTSIISLPAIPIVVQIAYLFRIESKDSYDYWRPPRRSFYDGVEGIEIISLEFEAGGKTRVLEIDSSSTEVDLSSLSIERLDLEAFKGFQNLKKLEMDSNDLRELDLSPLANCSSLEILDLSLNALHEIDLSPLIECEKLRGLNLGGNQMKTIDLHPLSFCINLEYLVISWILTQSSQNQIDLTPLSSCSKLQSLALYNNDLVMIDLSPIENCTSIEEIYLGENKLREVDLEPLGKCRHLTAFELHENPLRELDLEPLRNCTKLSHLNVSNTNLEELDISPLFDLPLLKRFSIDRRTRLIASVSRPQSDWPRALQKKKRSIEFRGL